MLLVPVADFLERQIAQQLGTDDLRAPTALRESWGSGTRRHAQSAWIEEQLVRCGWRSAAALAGLGRELPGPLRQVQGIAGRRHKLAGPRGLVPPDRTVPLCPREALR